MRVRAKVCGITSVEDAQAAAVAGFDAIGLMFAHGSSRRVTAEQAARVATAVPPFVSRVALFLDNDAEEVAHVLSLVPIDAIQFHGSEPAAFCDSFGKPYIKAVPMGDPTVRLRDWAERYPNAAAFLLDANRAGELGGRGQSFDWQRAVETIDRPIVIAGGLSANNVSEAIARFTPYAVDVSSGVESSPGVKSSTLMREFVGVINNGAFA